MASKDDLLIRITAKDATAKGVDSAERRLNGLGAVGRRVMGVFAGVFAVERLGRFTLEMTKLGGEVQGVEAAFERMNGTRQYLEELKTATAGTVSEIDLMKRAVQANNFDIPLTSLASLFEFATARAQQTGESVDYLVNSIIMGIGRKSPLILDNLGISAVQLRQRLKGVGTEAATVGDIAAVVGDIASEAMAESGAIIDENNLKVQNITAQWKDFKAQIATNKAVIESLGDSLTKTQQMMYVWNSDYATTLEKWAISVELFDKRAEKIYKQVKRRADQQAKLDEEAAQRKQMEIELNNLFGKSVNDATQDELDAAEKSAKAQWEQVRAKKEQGRTINEIKEETKSLQEELGNLGEYQDAERQKVLNQIAANEALVKSLTTLKTVRESVNMPKMTSIEAPEIGSGFDPALAGDMGDMEKATAQAKEKLNVMYAEIQAEVDRLNEGLTNAMAQGFAGGIEALFSGAGIEGILNAFLAPIGSFLIQEGTLLIAHGLAVESFKKSLQSLNGIAAIGAGAALVATGAAFKSFVGGGVGGGGGSYSGSGNGYSNYTPRNNSSNTQTIVIEGKLVAEGNDMVWNAQKNEYNIERTLG